MMMKSNLKGLPNLEVRDENIYAGCQNRKMHQVPYYETKFRARQPLELIHSDVFGLVKQPSFGGARYMVTFIDNYSKYVCVLYEGKI